MRISRIWGLVACSTSLEREINSWANLSLTLWTVVLATFGVHSDRVFSSPASCRDNRVNDSFLDPYLCKSQT
jgi:hypothetical protein